MTGLSSLLTREAIQKEVGNPATASNREIHTDTDVVAGIKRRWIAIKVAWATLSIAFRSYPSLFLAIRAAMGLRGYTLKYFGKAKVRKGIVAGGRFYFGIYTPGFPSEAFDRFIRTELNRMIPHHYPVNRFLAIQLAITSRCPLNCEHCYEWKNLNKAETFHSGDLKRIIDAFQEKGCSQFQFTGGEPMVKMDLLEDLIRYTSPRSECWVNTSGLNLTRENALRLKKAGATGVAISLDHFEPDSHNAFRGKALAFDWARSGIKSARESGLVVAVNLCAGRDFVNRENLLRYARMARDFGASFVQILEPKAVGRYEGKPVQLTREQMDILDDFYTDINFNPRFADYPVFIYHGYYLRRVSCLSGGYKVLYIDAAGYIHACPFCQTKSYDAHDLINGNLKADQIQLGGCPAKTREQLLA